MRVQRCTQRSGLGLRSGMLEGCTGPRHCLEREGLESQREDLREDHRLEDLLLGTSPNRNGLLWEWPSHGLQEPTR
jgi:hypothetical protein